METHDLINQAAGLVNEASRLCGIGEETEALSCLRGLQGLLNGQLKVDEPCQVDGTTEENVT